MSRGITDYNVSFSIPGEAGADRQWYQMASLVSDTIKKDITQKTGDWTNAEIINEIRNHEGSFEFGRIGAMVLIGWSTDNWVEEPQELFDSLAEAEQKAREVWEKHVEEREGAS